MYDLSPNTFALRRERLVEAMGDEAVFILAGPAMQTRSNDTHYAYRPNSDLLYLTGFREPETVLLLVPGHEDGPFVLFVPDRDPDKEQWEGRRAGPEGAKEKFGADQAYPLSELKEKLPDFLKGRKELYYTLGQRGDFDRQVIQWVQELRHKRNRTEHYPGVVIDPRDLLFSMRLYKEKEEVALLQRACDITTEAHILAMKHCRPGMYEYELQALLEYHFRRSGGEYPAYTTIVGAGDNATILHYTENRDLIEEGDVVLIDGGCEYHFYAGDITRSFPASGTFTAAQRDLYQAVLEVQIQAIDDLQVGIDSVTWRKRTEERLTEKMLDLGLLKGSLEQLVEEKAFRAYYPHGLGHPLGLDVHDVGLVQKSAEEGMTVAAGMVFTVEPGLYIPADDQSAPKEMRGVGIRIEDDILVTTAGPENLTARCPKSLEEIEALVGSGNPRDLEN